MENICIDNNLKLGLYLCQPVTIGPADLLSSGCMIYHNVLDIYPVGYRGYIYILNI